MSEQVPERLVSDQFADDAKLFEKAHQEQMEQRSFQKIVEIDMDPKRKKMPRILAGLSVLLAIVVLIIGSLVGYEKTSGLVGVFIATAIAFAYIGSRYGIPGSRSSKQHLDKLSAPDVVARRNETLADRKLKLAWIMHKRISAYNIAFEQLADMESDEWNEWAAVRLFAWQRKIEGEIDVIILDGNLPSPDRCKSLLEPLERLGNYMLLSPEEFLQACDLTGGRL
jgi:hypothetical protein